jgi:NTP pyrophosphatase (non-canonical NTP hydrolase)
MSIKELQSEVDQWIKTYGVRYYSELTNMAILSEECGEVARLISRMYGDQSFKKSEDEANAKLHLASELADVLFVLTCIANQCGIDLQQAAIENMKLKGDRDKERHHTNPKLT